ncbi:MAG TPA: methyltransferase domain-containing protein [Anaerolineaceae bacterium]
MKIMDLIQRTIPPNPWEEGEKIPWDEPDFSQRMLKEHLSQAHDAASRRFDLVDRQITWIHQFILGEKTSRVLDLGCGPGFYTSRLARLGHNCTGIDFSPASIEYARAQADAERLECSYRLADLRRGAYGEGYDLVMLLFGEFNVFSKADASLILAEAFKALKPGGVLLLEPHTFEAVETMGNSGSSWHSSKSGLFSPTPHLYLEENYWLAEKHLAATRYFILDAQTGEVQRYAAWMQAYHEKDYRQMLASTGFTQIEIYPSLTGAWEERTCDLIALVGRKLSA